MQCRMTQLEGEARKLREALSATEQRAAAATAKADVLQRAVAQVSPVVLITLPIQIAALMN